MNNNPIFNLLVTRYPWPVTCDPWPITSNLRFSPTDVLSVFKMAASLLKREMEMFERIKQYFVNGSPVKAVNELPQFLRIREPAFCLIIEALSWNALQGACWITYLYLFTSKTRRFVSFIFVSVVCTIYRFEFKCIVAVFSILFTMRCIVF